MKGKLYGIGTGPGDPELITLKAVRVIELCDYIAVPDAGNGERTAFSSVERYLGNKNLIECHFSMERDESKRIAQRIKAADKICSVLDEGKTVGFITLGDPTVYSTYMYVHRIAVERGFETEIIPGITSFTAAAARMNAPLCEGKEILTVIPAGCDEDIESMLSRPGTKVIMKSGKALTRILEIIKEKGLGGRTKIIERCTMDGEQIYDGDREFNGSGYFTTVIVKGS